MGQGYVRVDTGNNIADGNVINASDLDGEFDGLVAAFAASTGHTHDGTTGEGGPISITGPSGQYRHNANDYSPSTTNTRDLGTTSLRWKDLYLSGDADIDGAVDIASTLTVNDNITLNGTLTQSDSGVGPSYTRTSYGTFEINQANIGLEYEHDGVAILMRLVDSAGDFCFEVADDGSSVFRKELLVNYPTPQLRINNPDANINTRMWALSVSASSSALLFQNRTSGGVYNGQAVLDEDFGASTSSSIIVRDAGDDRYLMKGGLSNGSTDVSVSNIDFESIFSGTNTVVFAVSSQNADTGSAGDEKFQILGDGDAVNRNGNYGTISDIRLKEDISDAAPMLEDLNKFRVVNYRMKDGENSPKLLGFIAQEVEEIKPGLVKTMDDEMGTKTLKQSVMIPMLVKAVQELTTKVEALENKGN